MSKLNEASISVKAADLEKDKKSEERLGNGEAKEEKNVVSGERKAESDKKGYLGYSMIFNNCNKILELKKNSRNEENRYKMLFNKEVTIRQRPEKQSSGPKIVEIKKAKPVVKHSSQGSRSKSKFGSQDVTNMEPQVAEPGMMFPSSLTSSFTGMFEENIQTRSENLKKFLNKRNSKPELDPHQKDLRIHNSLTSLPKNGVRQGPKGLKSKIPSLTALDVNFVQQKSGLTRFSYWDHWNDLFLTQADVDKRLSLQISRSSNDNNRRSAHKLKKDDVASVSDSKLLNTNHETKKHIKKCDKKSRGDSSKKERDTGSRKQVQWKTEVDVIYFSTHLGANGDKSGEVLGRVMEPLREEWEQQRKGFYARMVSSHMESLIKDRFISLLYI